jgi:DNA polymerase III sliding clamp (beta) subunit (PCNA family)
MTNYTILSVNQLNAVSGAASHQQTRYYLNGVFIETLNNQPAMVATDGQRLYSMNASRKLEDGQAITDSFILPNDTIERIIKTAALDGKALSKGKRDALHVIITHDKQTRAITWAICTIEEGISHAGKGDAPAHYLTTYSKGEGHAIDGNFPDWRRALPVKDEMAVIAPIGFNAGYLADFARAAKLLTGKAGAALAINALAGAESPLEVTIPSCPAFYGVLMPMRIK